MRINTNRTGAERVSLTKIEMNLIEKMRALMNEVSHARALALSSAAEKVEEGIDDFLKALAVKAAKDENPPVTMVVSMSSSTQSAPLIVANVVRPVLNIPTPPPLLNPRLQELRARLGMPPLPTVQGDAEAASEGVEPPELFIFEEGSPAYPGESANETRKSLGLPVIENTGSFPIIINGEAIPATPTLEG